MIVTLLLCLFLELLLLLPGKIVQWIANLLYIGTDVEDMSHIDISNYVERKLDYSYEGKYGQDLCKFLGMHYFAERTQKVWDDFLNHIDFDNVIFTRNKENSSGWSGDMMSGALLAISTRYTQGLLTAKEKTFLFDYAWKMATAWFPFRQDYDDWSRGYIWQPLLPVLGMNSLQPLIILKLGYLNGTGIKSYVLMYLYYLFLIVQYPIMFFGCLWDATIIVNKGPFRFYLQWTYTTHSSALTCASGCMLNIPGAQKGLEVLNKKHGNHNLDIYMLHKEFVQTGLTLENINYCFSVIRQLKWSRDFVNTLPLPDKDIYYLKRFRWEKTYDNTICGFRCQNNTCWERSQYSRGGVGQNDGDLDQIFPLSIIDRLA